ncbi:MAG: hypothetical protein P4L73_03515 [Caulobacteraceae bacterium]|nr:hypothetical protein [Caulobacteraceae bacterium]
MTANAGRPDLDAMIKFAAVPASEPVFLLRAQDEGGGDGARDWAARAHARGVPVAVIEQALQQADRMDAWPTHKAPDADHLTENERKRLEQQFRRRAWTAGIDAAPDVGLALAYQRGVSECESLIRDLARALKGAALSLEWRIECSAPDGWAADHEEHLALKSFRDLVVAPALARAETAAASPLRKDVYGG